MTMSRYRPLARWASSCAAIAATSILALSPVAGWAAPPPPTASSQVYLFAFQDAEIAKVIEAVLDSIDAPYTIDPAISGRMSLRLDQRLTRPQLIEALGAALAANSVAMVRDKDRLVFTPMSKARSTASVKPYQEGSRRVGYEIVAVPLLYAQPSEVAKTLETIAGKSQLLIPYDKLGLMVIGGGGPDLDSTLETLKVFDQNLFAESKVRWFQLNEASSSTVAEELQHIVQASGSAGVTIVPLKRLNGLIVFSRSAEVFEDLRKMISRLDVADGQGASSLWIYHPRHTSAEALARTLSAVFTAENRSSDLLGSRNGASSSATTGTGAMTAGAPSGVSSQTAQGDASAITDLSGKLTVDKESNTLFLTGSPADWIKAQKILVEIDRLPNQIFVEASIVEVTLGNDRQFGVDWSALSGDFRIASLTNKAGTIGPSAPGGSFTFLHGDIAAAVNALGSVNKIQVVSAPKIIVLDNKTARLQIGDQVPTVSQSQQSTSNGSAPVINSIDYRSTGVLLSVTPRISGEQQVTMEVAQEVSSVSKTLTSGIDSPTIQQRKFESALVLQSGGVVALGGLISTNFNDSRSGVPGLKSLPVVGALFSNQGRSQSRTELIVLMSATILRDSQTTNAAMADLYQDMKELQRSGLLPAP
ncbi:MAG TPA: secretin N-terminal domain-containing protein [Caulobacter sp.]|nr:secretin N-terminal domain-containing protein [Caulobacter sp.]